MLTSSPVVLDDVLDVCHPAPAVVTESPSVLETRPPTTTVLDLNRPRWIEAALLEEADRGHNEPSSTEVKCGTKSAWSRALIRSVSGMPGFAISRELRPCGWAILTTGPSSGRGPDLRWSALSLAVMLN
jgi:hypothetical protein